MRIGFTEAAGQFMNWIENRCHEFNPDDPLQIMYGIDGHHDLAEETLDHWTGTWVPGPCGSATARTTSSSSISTAS